MVSVSLKFRGFRDFRKSSTQLLVCSCLSCLRRFRDFRRFREIGIVQKVFSEKASAIARMRQKCVRNASKMRQKCVKMGLVLLGKKSEIRQNCVQNASKMRGTPLGENTFWTIPMKGDPHANHRFGKP